MNQRYQSAGQMRRAFENRDVNAAHQAISKQERTARDKMLLKVAPRSMTAGMAAQTAKS